MDRRGFLQRNFGTPSRIKDDQVEHRNTGGQVARYIDSILTNSEGRQIAFRDVQRGFESGHQDALTYLKAQGLDFSLATENWAKFKSAVKTGAEGAGIGTGAGVIAAWRKTNEEAGDVITTPEYNKLARRNLLFYGSGGALLFGSVFACIGWFHERGNLERFNASCESARAELKVQTELLFSESKGDQALAFRFFDHNIRVAQKKFRNGNSSPLQLASTAMTENFILKEFGYSI